MTKLRIDPRSVRGLVVVLVLLTTMLSGTLLGLEFALLLLAASTLTFVIWLLWGSVQSLTGAAPLSFEEALSFGAPSAEEEQKRSLLRALKDLEYERSVGKISPEDYAEFSERYRTEAKRLIQTLDKDLSGARHQAEALLERRLQGSEIATRPATTASTPFKSRPQRACSSCAADNELDADFCKKCGKPMAENHEHLCLHCPARLPKGTSKCPTCGSTQEVKG